MSFYTSTHLIVSQSTKIEAVRSDHGAWLLLTEHGDGIHRIDLSLNDAESVDRMLDALSEAQAMLVDPQHPARVVVGSEAA